MKYAPPAAPKEESYDLGPPPFRSRAFGAYSVNAFPMRFIEKLVNCGCLANRIIVNDLHY